MERKRIGIITKPQALKGEFRVKPDLLNLKQYKTFKSIYIDGVQHEVEKVILREGFVIFKVTGVDTCEKAESLRNVEVFADLKQEKVDDNDYVNYEVVVGGSSVGKIVEINNYGSKDIWSISGEKNLMLPYIDGLVDVCDDNAKTITLNKEIFLQVAVYED